MRLDDLQDQVGEWAHRNFGSDPDHRLHPLLGMIEELGELAEAVRKTLPAFPEESGPEGDAVACVYDLLWAQALFGRIVHAALKGLQGIRGHDMERVASLSGCSDALCDRLEDLCGKYQIPFSVDLVTGPSSAHAAQVDAVGDITVYMADFCRRNEISLDQAVTETWARVSQRNWKADPEKGGFDGQAAIQRLRELGETQPEGLKYTFYATNPEAAARIEEMNREYEREKSGEVQG